MSNTDALVIDGLKKSYRRNGKSFEAVRSVSLNLLEGEVLAFLGPNGAGKTTTVKMIAGLIQPDRGVVKILGTDPFTNPKAIRHLGAVLEGNRNLYWRLTPLENLEYFGTLRGLTRKEARLRSGKLLEQFNLSGKRHTIVQNLSRGMQQKLAFAVALIHRPSLLLLDEPTLALDVESTQIVKSIIRETSKVGCSVFLTTHQLDIAEELSDRVTIIHEGTVIASSKTRDLIRTHSKSSYSIEFEGNLNSEMVNLLHKMSVVVEPSKIIYSGDSKQQYRIIEVLKPLPILAMYENTVDLTEIFLKMTRNEKDV